jgi:hypothetical protein
VQHSPWYRGLCSSPTRIENKKKVNRKFQENKKKPKKIKKIKEDFCLLNFIFFQSLQCRSIAVNTKGYAVALPGLKCFKN